MSAQITNKVELKKAIRKCRRVLVFALFAGCTESWVIIAKKEALHLIDMINDDALVEYPADWDHDQNVVYLNH